ncbi:transmembrane protein, putative (macronuclear) [Tetrahymena thermophila SB210]|uniref:Transmembrane protein, putative n=1 Tax=Tetrahymena thermophila (strain SB210) TaxID=312017 RepID=Q245N7_TETTS|nr:transmembrane protein, putative [Tetrahymena thermophila SB210]EAS03596.2 transmembrane protein, putative [Tetrahymena thermophila SB210]|eukprot:XP_001023841.2 transmembrane protein, putative [Tetrahymena thermophila SB210]
MISEETLKYCNHINDLIPNPIRQHHNQIVQNFLKTGKSKSFRKLSKIYIRDKLNYAQECIIFFDIDSLQLNDLSLITFIKPIRSYSSTVSLFFDFDGNLQCSTPNIWQNLFQKEEMIEFEKTHLHNLSWYSLFPKIQEYITSNQTQERNFNKFFKVKMFLPKENSVNSKSQSASSFNIPKVFYESQKVQSSYKQRGFIEFEVALNVIQQPYQNRQQGRYERYYIFELDDIKKIRDDSTSGNSTSFTKLDSSFKTNTADNISVNSAIKITNGLETEQNTNEDEADHIRQQNLLKNKKKSQDSTNQISKNAQQVNNIQLDKVVKQDVLEQQTNNQNQIQLQNQSKVVASNGSDNKQQILEKSPTFKNQSSSDLGKTIYQGQNRDQFSPSRLNNTSTYWTFNNFMSSEEVIPIRDQRSTSQQQINGNQIRVKKSSSIHQENNKDLEVIQEHIDSKSPRESDRKESVEESFQYQYISLQKEFISDHQEKANKYFQQDLDLSPVQLNPTDKYTLQKKQQENSNNNNNQLDGKLINKKIDIDQNDEATKLDFKYNQDISNLLSNKNNSQSNQYLIKTNQELNDLKQFQDLSKQEIKLNYDLSNYDYSINGQKNLYQETDYKELEVISIDRNYGVKDANNNQILQNHSFYENQIKPSNKINIQNDIQKQQQMNAISKGNQQIFYDNKSEESSSDSNQAQQDKNQNLSPQYYGLTSPTMQFVSPRDVNQQILQLSAKNLLNSTSEETSGVSLNNQSYLPFSQNQLISPKNSSFQQLQKVEKIEECVTEEDDENDTQHKRKTQQKKQDLNQKLFFQSRIKSQYYDKSQKKKKHQSRRQKFMESMEITSTNQPNMDQKEEEANQIKNNYQSSVANTNKFGRYQYLQKYQKLHYFMESKSNPKSLMYFLYLRITELVASIILISSFTIFIKTLINNHQSNIQILKYQSEFLGPIDQGFGCIWQGVNYYFQMATKVRNYTTYKQHINFISANINYTYTNLKSFSEVDQSNPVILDFLDSQTYLFQPDGYKNVNTVLQYNRLIIYQLVKAFKYISNWNWDKLQDISVYEFDVGFLNANIMAITDLFSKISQQTMDSLQNDVSYQNQLILIILIIMMLVFCILSAISTNFYVKYLRLKEALIELFRYIDKAWADNEIERSKKSLQQIENYNNLNFLNGYNFSLEEKDSHLGSMEDKKNSSIKSYRQGNNSKSFKIVQKRFVNKILILIMYFIFVAGTTSCLIGVYIYNTQYINSYVSACKTYQKFADSHSLVSRLTGLQEFYYSITANWFKYMNYSNITTSIPEYNNLLIQAQNFVSSELQNTQNLGSNQFLDDFQNFIVSLQNTNLCTQILNMQDYNLQLCQQIQSGSMQTGIITTFTQLLNDLNNEHKITNFNITLRNPRYPDGDHLEAGIMCTRILKYASDILNRDIQQMIDSAWKIMLLMTILFLMFMLILNLSLVLYGYYYFVQDYKYTKRCLLLLPLNTLILENAFNSNLRILYLQNGLMDEQ